MTLEPKRGRPRKEGNRIPLFVRIDANLHDRLWQYIRDLYPQSTHGALSIEVQNAIAHWINEQGMPAHTPTHMNPGIPRTQATIDRIIQMLRNMGFVNQFTTGDWRKACIAADVGADKRTIRKYMQLATELSRIKNYSKFKSGMVWEIV